MERVGFIGFWSGIAYRKGKVDTNGESVTVRKRSCETSLPLWRPVTSPSLFSDNLPLINVKIIRGDGVLDFTSLTWLPFCLLSKAAALLTVCSYFPISTLSFYSLLRSTSSVPPPFFSPSSRDFAFSGDLLILRWLYIVTTLTYDTERCKWFKLFWKLNVM